MNQAKPLCCGLWLGCAVACGTVTTAAPEELADPGQHDASVDQALSFDGVDDYASIGTARAPQIMLEQSLMFWFQAQVAGGGADADLQVLFTLRRSDWSGIALALDRGVPLAYDVFGPRDLARATLPVTPRLWHHLAYVIEQAGSQLYLDGAALATLTPGIIPGTNRTPTQAFIGSLDGYADMFHGALDELRVYPRAFSAAEVQAVATGQKPGEAEPLVLYLPFNEAAGARSYDRSGLGNHAELGDGVASLMPTRIRSGVP